MRLSGVPLNGHTKGHQTGRENQGLPPISAPTFWSPVTWHRGHGQTEGGPKPVCFQKSWWGARLSSGGRPCLCSRLASHFRESGMRPLPSDMQLCWCSASSEWKLSNMVHTYSADCQDQSFRWLLQSFSQQADPGFISLGHPSSIC